MVRTIVKSIAALVLVAAALWGGAAYQNHVDAVSAKARTVAILGIAVCNQFLGAVTVAGNGKLTSSPNMTPEEVGAIGRTLPDDNAAVVAVPCPKGASTT